MKKYIVIATLLLSSGIFAQQPDSLLHRQMELQREFNPTLQDANKITSLPALHEPTVKKANTAYSTWAGRTKPPLEIAMSRPESIMIDIPFDIKKGYISLSAGNYANIDGALGYRLIDNAQHALNVLFLHNSTNGDIKYVQDTDPKNNKVYWMENAGTLNYTRFFDSFQLGLSGGYAHSIFNYYGNTFGNSRFYENQNQTLGVFQANAHVQSIENSMLNYIGNLHFRNFDTKFGSSLNEAGIGGNQADLHIDLNKPFFSGDNKIGLAAKATGVFYDNEAFHNVHLIGASPYITFQGFNWKATFGINFEMLFAEEKKPYLSPHVELSYAVTEHSSLYAHAKGGMEANTYLDMMEESRYIAPMLSVKPAYTPFDIAAGAKIGEAAGFRFDIFGGFKKTKDAHFFILPSFYDIMPSLAPKPLLVREFLQINYGTLNHSHIGTMIQSNIWAPLDMALRVKKNFYTVNDIEITDAKAYNLPGLEADVRATWEAMSNLKLTLNYSFAGERWLYFNGANTKMNDIHDFNLGATYQINNQFSVNLKAHNLLFQKYDIWYGHPAQGFNAMGGFVFKF